MPNVTEILAEWLQEHGYDGLLSEDEDCDCTIEELVPCLDVWGICRAGRFIRCEACEEEKTCDAAKRRAKQPGCIFEPRGPLSARGDSGRTPDCCGDVGHDVDRGCRLDIGRRLDTPGAPAWGYPRTHPLVGDEIAQVRSPGGVTHLFYVGNEVALCGARIARWTVTLDKHPAALCRNCTRVYEARYDARYDTGRIGP